MKPAYQYALDRIRAMAPPTGDARRAMMDDRLSPMAATMTTPNDPMLDFYSVLLNERGEDGTRPLGPTMPEQMAEINALMPYGGDTTQNLMAGAENLMESGIAPGFGMMGTVGKVGPLWDDLSKTRLTRPVDEMTRTTVPAHDMTPQATVSPESLQGSILQPLLGDRSAAGEYLTAINDAPLANPVLLEGGPDFMRGTAAQADNAIWASNPGVPTRLQNNVNSAAREFDTDNINLVYTANGARNADFATMTTDAILEQIPSSPILRKTIKQFDQDMKKLVPDWPGVESNNLRDFLFRPGMGDQRKAFVELIAKGKYQELGFPDMGSTRFAITNPGLLGEPTGVSGYAIGRGIPDADVLSSPSVPHTTYAHQMQGDYLGGLDVGVPREVMFPDFYAQRRNLGADPARDDRAFMMRNISQEADQRWLDGIMQYINSVNN